jgi:hypothetical protein
MGLEAASFINDLVDTNPVAGDNVSQGDDHIRLLKAVLKAQFPALSRAIYLEQASVDLASSTTPDLSTPASNYINITGTTQIDGFATEPAGFVRLLRFAGILTLNYNATSLILPSSDDIITAAGDHAIAVSLGGGNWRIVSFFRASGRALVETVDTITSLGGIAQGVHQLYLPAGGFMSPTSFAALPGILESVTNQVSRAVMTFPASGTTRAVCEFALPKSWNAGSTITAQVDWETLATDTDAVLWGVEMLLLGDGDTIDQAFSGVTIVDNCQSSSGKQYRTGVTGAITPTGAADAKRALLRVYRTPADVSDTIAETCYLNGVLLNITINATNDA